MRKSPHSGGEDVSLSEIYFVVFFSKSKILEEIFRVQILCFIR